MVSPHSLCLIYPVIRDMSCLVLLAALLLCDLINVLGETVKVLLLLLELLLELNELLLLTLADSVILAGLLTSLESITRASSRAGSSSSTLSHDAGSGREASNGSEGGCLAERCAKHDCEVDMVSCCYLLGTKDQLELRIVVCFVADDVAVLVGEPR